jgi:hypothetical protein
MDNKEGTDIVEYINALSREQALFLIVAIISLKGITYEEVKAKATEIITEAHRGDA